MEERHKLLVDVVEQLKISSSLNKSLSRPSSSPTNIFDKKGKFKYSQYIDVLGWI